MQGLCDIVFSFPVEAFLGNVRPGVQCCWLLRTGACQRVLLSSAGVDGCHGAPAKGSSGGGLRVGWGALGGDQCPLSEHSLACSLACVMEMKSCPPRLLRQMRALLMRREQEENSTGQISLELPVRVTFPAQEMIEARVLTVLIGRR